MAKKEKWAWFLIRAGIAFAFLYAAIAGYLRPNDWIGYFPATLRHAVPENILLYSWGIFETVIALWILSGKKVFVPSLLAVISLAGLIFTNFSQMDVIFRDVTILAVAAALAIHSRG